MQGHEETTNLSTRLLHPWMYLYLSAILVVEETPKAGKGAHMLKQPLAAVLFPTQLHSITCAGDRPGHLDWCHAFSSHVVMDVPRRMANTLRKIPCIFKDTEFREYPIQC